MDGYAFTDGGLPNIQLLNGYKVDTAGFARFREPEALRAAIALHVATDPAALTPAALLFLRNQLGFSQRVLGAHLGVSAQSVYSCERGTHNPGAAVVRLLRLLVAKPADPCAFLATFASVIPTTPVPTTPEPITLSYDPDQGWTVL